MAGLSWASAIALAGALAFSAVAEAKEHGRSRIEKCAFLRSQGVQGCRVPAGYVVDHINPLCAGGADHRSNMQLQTIAAAKLKDRWERQLCARRK